MRQFIFLVLSISFIIVKEFIPIEVMLILIDLNMKIVSTNSGSGQQNQMGIQLDLCIE